MFFIFIMACKKYEFNFNLNAHNRLVLTLYPSNSFESIDIDQGYFNYNFIKLFLSAIKEMKTYRKMVGY